MAVLELDLELDALVKAGIFQSKAEVVEEALRLLFASRPQLRLDAATQLFKEGAVTLGRAAEIAGITRWEFEAILQERRIEHIVTCDSAADLDHQAEPLHR